MKKLFVTLAALFLAAAVHAQMPKNTPENLRKYKAICREHIYKDMKGMYREAGSALPYPFLTPGSSAYSDVLFDWDSWLSDIAIRQILLEKGTDEDRNEALKYEQGCILNFLAYGGADGWIPVWIARQDPPRAQMLQTRNIWKCNMHKPTLAQHAAFIVKNMNGDAEWLRDGFYNMQAFVNKYLNYHRHRATGLLYWEDDFAIGVDNDPSTFYRPHESSGSIYLNTLMYKELQAISYLAGRLNLKDIADFYTKEANKLRDDIREHCWDPRDGFYYSVDLNLLPVEKPDTEGTGFELHSGQPRNYDCLIQRFSVWSGFMALWAGIATPEQAEKIVGLHYRNKESFNAPAGIRTLSPQEKMYDVRASGNPSTWLGPTWIIANYMTFRGLVGYGYKDDARELAEKTILLLGRDFERFGALHENYMPDNGEPILNKGFQNWNYLVLNMAAWLDGKPTVTEF